MKKALPLLALAAVLAGCAPAPTFDASNSHQSAKAMQDALPVSQRELFEASIGYLAAQRLFTPEMERLVRSGRRDEALEAASTALADLDGLSAKQIIRLADLSLEQVKQWQEYRQNGWRK